MLDAADTIVWLDLPLRVWLPRLVRRTRRRIKGDEMIFNDNRESWRTALVGWDSLFVFALRSHFRAAAAGRARYAALPRHPPAHPRRGRPLAERPCLTCSPARPSPTT